MIIQKTFELYAAVAGGALVVISFLYDLAVINIPGPNPSQETITIQLQHLAVSEWVFRIGAVIIILAACAKVIRGLWKVK